MTTPSARRIVANFFVSLDGVVESPDQWQFPYFNDEMGDAIGASFAASDALLLGRVNYTQWAEFWPTSTDQPMADMMNGVTKYVVSSTLETVEWSNSHLINGDVAARLRELKQQPGKDIAMSGSGTLVRWLLGAGLLDELRLLVHPVVVGHGSRLFPGDSTFALELVRSVTFKTGVVDLTYRPVVS